MSFHLAITLLTLLHLLHSWHPPISISVQNITTALQELGFHAVNVRQMMTTCPSHQGVQCKQHSWCVLYGGGQQYQEYPEKDDYTRLLSAATVWHSTQAERLQLCKGAAMQKATWHHPSIKFKSLISKMAMSTKMYAAACCSRQKIWHQCTCHNMQKCPT